HYTRQCLEAKRRGLVKKVISTVWETIPHNNEGIYGRKAFKARALHELDHIIAVTSRAKQALVSEGADPDKISVIGAHVDTKLFRPATHISKKVTPGGQKQLTILYCGRLVPEKGVEEILTAMKALANNKTLADYQLQWHFVGNGNLRKDVEAAARLILKNWHSTIETAKYSDMPKIYQHADIFVAPSKPSVYWEEQYGMALLEAQASGLPIVTTNSGGIPENVGEVAVIVPPGDAASLSHAIYSLVTNPAKRRRMGEASRARAVRVHDITLGAKKLSALYEQVISS
ncbi:glycosyltransferase family 4 protein, partial [Candidatus Gottesmanbacteria bacterium]|nr:glycosyltransferase family 4 protein [Candidatus Gottesmanbacteria bacterium]